MLKHIGQAAGDIVEYNQDRNYTAIDLLSMQKLDELERELNINSEGVE